MEKEMLAIAKFKSGEGKFEKFMGWMQSDEGMGVRKTIAHVEKTVPAIAPIRMALFPSFLPNTASPTEAPSTSCERESIA